MKKNRKAVVDRHDCVSCGSCVKVCPRGAIRVPNGIYAVVDETLCVGCGLCAKACPASTIFVKEWEVSDDEN